MPNIKHPKKFRINGMYFQVMSYAPLSDKQAARLTKVFYNANAKSFKKSDKGKTFIVLIAIDGSLKGIL